MGTKLSPQDNELCQRIDEVLHYIWDPIGVRTEPNARDEYESYLPHVFSMVKHGVSAAALARHLQEITTGRMGLSSVETHDLEVAQLILDWQRTVAEKYANLV
jgi:hypothetical protein